MLDWEGNIIKSKYFKKHTLDTPLSVSILVTRYEEEVNTPIYASFSAFNISEEKNEFTSMYQSGVNIFASILNDNDEKSNFGIPIGSANVDDYNCDILEPIGDDTIFMQLDDFQSGIHADQAANPNTVSPEFLSKICKIDNEKAIKVLDHNTHLNRQGSDK